MTTFSLPAEVKVRKACRVCPGEVPLEPVFDLGAIHLSEFPANGAASHLPIPLELARCPACTLVQLGHTTPPDWMYQEYWYRSGVNERMVEELRQVVGTAYNWAPLGASDYVLDIGANDGTLLSMYKGGAYRTAFDPAQNLTTALTPHAETVYSTYFPPPPLHPVWLLAGKVRHIHTIACFYDLDDPNAFVAGIKRLLHPWGVWIVQFQDLLQMLEASAFDCICHEHLEYYSLYSFMRTIEHNALKVLDVLPTTINGGSLRIVVGHRDHPGSDVGTGRVLQQIEQEHVCGLTKSIGDGKVPFTAFKWKVGGVRRQIRAAVDQAVAEGVTVDGYGASTKGSTLLQVCGLGRKQIRQIWERSPEKWGRQTVGTWIPIVSEEVGRADPPGVMIVPIWQFREQVIAREKEYLAAGGKLLFPLPQVEIVGGDL